MPGPQAPSRAVPFASQRTGESLPPNAALLGATKAFGRPVPKETVQSRPEAGRQGDVAVIAPVAGGGKMQNAPQPGSSHARSATSVSPTRSLRTTPADAGRFAALSLNARATPNLAVPRTQRDRSKPPSHHAAQIAAARSPARSAQTPPVRQYAKPQAKPVVAPKPRRLSNQHSNDRMVTRVVKETTDASPILPTTSLVQLYERQSNGRGKTPDPIAIRHSADLALHSPKPMRSADPGITSVFHMELPDDATTPRAAPNIAAHDFARDEIVSSSDSYVSASEDTAQGSSPITIRKQRETRAQTLSPVNSVSPASIPSIRLRPSASPFNRPGAVPMNIRPPPRNMISPPVSFSASQSSQSITAQYRQMHPRRMTPLSTNDALANALVASSLATTRAPSPAKVPPPAMPPRRHNTGHHKLSFSRTPSPTKHTGMRHTMRKEDSSDSDGVEDDLHPYGKHKKKRLVRKHPNKHHEGGRKRWRDAITERERKRYAGVWAANKGLYCTISPEEEINRRDTNHSSQGDVSREVESQVSNIVARDIWNRSRLPGAVLETVWDLVDEEGLGRLSKERFMVGMWLIDQRLKGRKLPPRVSDSVWSSVRGLEGLKLRKK